MSIDKQDLLLYAVTDRTWMGESTLAAQAKEAIEAGVTMIQLREKNLDYGRFFELAMAVRRVTERSQIPFVINDNVDVALACGADGIHVGQKDQPADEVRRQIGPGKILGVSVQTVQQAICAEQSGADYLGVGAMFLTSTKQDASKVSFETLKTICGTVNIPVVAIGGIGKNNILRLGGSGIAGVAVVSAIFAQPDISAAAAELRRLAETMAEGQGGR
ncbi:MAG TPA: thiamine phosphate synthase [Peptococcaceae bacterium]|nr:thiamine phosphate synthase [Peptococcaceae bacterium]